MELDYSPPVFDEFSPRNFAGHAEELAPHYARWLKHNGRTGDEYGGPNYREIILLAADSAAALLGRPLTVEDHPHQHRPGGTIIMAVTDWTDDDVCACTDEWRRLADLFGEVRFSDMKDFVCRPRREVRREAREARLAKENRGLTDDR